MQLLCSYAFPKFWFFMGVHVFVNLLLFITMFLAKSSVIDTSTYLQLFLNDFVDSRFSLEEFKVILYFNIKYAVERPYEKM